MTNTLCLNEKYSTTKLLTKEKTIIENNPEDKFETVLFLPEGKNRKGEGGLRTKGYFKKSYEDKPLISIITVVCNGVEYLEQTIKSVINQSYDNVEYIIIDGGSTDGTLDVIRKYEDQIDYWVSEKDDGIYDAMNKGIKLCYGEYVGFLNADDWYNDIAIYSIVNSLQNNSYDFIFANVDIYDCEDKYSHKFCTRISKYNIYMPFGHPALFVRKTFLLLFPFDLKYKTASDYDFICKIIKMGLTYLYLNESIVNFREGGISTLANTDKELFVIRKKHFGLITAIYSYILTTKQPIIKSIVNFAVSIKHSIEQRKIIWHQSQKNIH